jgi:hypothetical protein
MKRGSHKKEKKALSAAGLLSVVRESFSHLTPAKQKRKISFLDCIMSALAIFNLKFPSLLAFDDNKADPVIQHNLKTLFEVKNVPCDTHMREVLDDVDPKELRQSFLSVFHEAQRGKLLERYEFLDGHYLCLVDGTELFNSEKIHCKNCCKKRTQRWTNYLPSSAIGCCDCKTRIASGHSTVPRADH